MNEKQWICVRQRAGSLGRGMTMKPILFNTDMVRATLENRKTVTRRVVKPRPVCYGPNITFQPHANNFSLSAEKHWLRCRECGHDPEYSREGSNISHHWKPPYKPGDILYVRETFIEYKGKYHYKADGEHLATNALIGGKEFFKWHPSIHMPKDAARIFLRVTDVRVERLQEITPEQIDAEGFKEYGYSVKTGELMPSGPSFFSIGWDSTVKKADRSIYGWAANPWVWVIEFELISKENAIKHEQSKIVSRGGE